VKASRVRVVAGALAFAASVVLVPLGIANADCTTAGDFGAAAGCAPSDDSSGPGKAESWPPTSVDWPPQLGSDKNGGDKNGGDKGGGNAKPTPIVMPDGQKPPPATPAPTSGAPSATSTPIVAPHG